MESKDEKSKFSTISLPTPLIDKIKEKIKGTGMHSPSAYVTFVLREIFSENPESGEDDKSNKDETSIKQRLRNLGYL